MRGTPAWVWVLAVLGALTLVRGWLLRPAARTWIICPQLEPGATDSPEGAEPLEVLLRRVWYELGPRDAVVLVASPDWPLSLWQRIERLQRRFPFRLEASVPAVGHRTVVYLRPRVEDLPAAPAAIVTHREGE